MVLVKKACDGESVNKSIKILQLFMIRQKQALFFFFLRLWHAFLIHPNISQKLRVPVGTRNLSIIIIQINPLSSNPTKWSNTLKQFVGNSRWALKGLNFKMSRRGQNTKNSFTVKMSEKFRG